MTVPFAYRPYDGDAIDIAHGHVDQQHVGPFARHASCDRRVRVFRHPRQRDAVERLIQVRFQSAQGEPVVVYDAKGLHAYAHCLEHASRSYPTDDSSGTRCTP